MRKFSIACLLIIMAFSCTKHQTASYSGPSLWPLKAGNQWIYQDSLFSDSGVTNAYADTVTLTASTKSDFNGNLYYGFNDPTGWFGAGTYIGIDPYSTTVFEWDSLQSPYVFFQTAQQDGTVVGSGTDFTNAVCPKQLTQYGFITPVTLYGYTCQQNIEYTIDCNNITTEAVITYISPGVGLVRIEDYMADTTRNNALYLDYSQTLGSVQISK